VDSGTLVKGEVDMNEERSCENCGNCTEEGACPFMAVKGERPVPVTHIRLRLPLICKHYDPKPELSAFEKAFEEDDYKLCINGDLRPKDAYKAGWNAAVDGACGEIWRYATKTPAFLSARAVQLTKAIRKLEEKG